MIKKNELKIELLLKKYFIDVVIVIVQTTAAVTEPRPVQARISYLRNLRGKAYDTGDWRMRSISINMSHSGSRRPSLSCVVRAALGGGGSVEALLEVAMNTFAALTRCPAPGLRSSPAYLYLGR